MRERIFSQSCTWAVLATALLAQEPREPTAPSEALLFKSGQSWVYREVAVQPGAERTRLRLPDALHGTAWLSSTAVRLQRAIAREVEITEKRPCTDLAGVLRRYRGRSVTLMLQLGQETSSAAGRIVRVIEAEDPVHVPFNRFDTVMPIQPTLVVLQQNDRLATYPVRVVVGVVSAEADSTEDGFEYEHALDAAVLDVEHSALPADAAAGTIGLAAMTDGLAWTPSYVLELGDGNAGQARLVGKAVVVNDSEALADTNVRLVIGYPNLRFAGVRSSLLPGVTLEHFRQQLGAAQGDAVAEGAMSQIMSNVVTRGRAGQGQAGAAGPTEAISGESAEDLYVYDVGRMTLGKGERAYVPLVAATVPLRHRFDWELPDEVQNSRFVRQEQGGDDPPVWHVLLLDNPTDAPWTTAPVLVQGERGPLAQSMLRYTPAGATDSRLELTKALDFVGEALEYRTDEAQSPRNERILFSNRYEEVEVEGRLELVNRGGRNAPVRVQKQFSGDLIEAEGEPQVRGRSKSLGDVNAARTMTWEFELAPGATWQATYRYRVLIRR